jgi:hypothetical protein
MRKELVGLLAVALVLVGAVLALVMPRHCPVNRAAFERIKPGMTRAEVHAILGGPQGDYRTRPPRPRPFISAITDGVSNGVLLLSEWWQGDEGAAVIEYRVCWPNLLTAHAEVARARFVDADPHHPGLVELIRWRLKRLLWREPDLTGL